MQDYTKYFKESVGFDRFIKEIYKKYQKLSRFSGTVKLEHLSLEEAEALSRLFGANYKEDTTVFLSIKKFLDIMSCSKYMDFSLSVLIEEYLGVCLESNKERKNRLLLDEENFYISIIGNDETEGSKWLKNVVEKKLPPYRLLQQRYKKDKNDLKKELEYVIQLVNHLPKDNILLSVFSSMYTRDPHYLDLDNRHCVVFLYALSFIDETSFPETREGKIRLLAKYHIDVDSLSNFVITYGLLSDRAYMNCFAQVKESLLLNTQNIMGSAWFDTRDKKVFVFENPSILTEIMARNVKASVVISGGFPNSSVYLLLDKLVERGNQLFYNGDFDPEGLVIAQMLKVRYKECLHLICYDEEDYVNCNSKKMVSQARVQKLLKVEEETLGCMKELLLEKKMAGYQENNKDRVISVVCQLLGKKAR